MRRDDVQWRTVCEKRNSPEILKYIKDFRFFFFSILYNLAVCAQISNVIYEFVSVHVSDTTLRSRCLITYCAPNELCTRARISDFNFFFAEKSNYQRYDGVYMYVRATDSPTQLSHALLIRIRRMKNKKRTLNKC